MVVVDTLTKETHFILVKSTFGTAQIANIFLRDIFRLHGIPKMIVLDRDEKFTSKFYKNLFKCFGTNFNFSSAFHPQTNKEN